MNGFDKPMLPGGPPQQGGMGGPPPQGGQPGPMQGPPQMGPGMGGNPAESFNFLAGPGGQAFSRGQQRDNYQGQINDLMQQIQFGQLQGANPMQMADLQMQLQRIQQDMGNWQNQQYGQQMGQMSQAGAPAIGGGPGNRSQMQQNPFLHMLLQSQLGMGGGGSGGGPYGPQIG